MPLVFSSREAKELPFACSAQHFSWLMCVNLNQERNVNTMKYETPEVTMLTPAINAVQSPADLKCGIQVIDGVECYESTASYADWE